ncbi:LacI family DNA-binding transcriptional regulator [Isoptericola cucumis]|uniref:LacI family transcriptional regulator n=1 Tax=Isoptericola cucumis TaxID=1776856 RepID=A0ABQ2B9S2_9MICO|nr:LacI family DNA-binding transcriptional regulator [Isoptericola cucumis]GGI09450.1 LacI family transcriptional regulator [Isoptericola cucumis]
MTYDTHGPAASPLAGHSRGGRRPTLAAVAQRAGVSLKTASRVLNQEPNVATATRERVQAAALALGFRRNAVAADLARGGASRLVGFVTGDLANPFYSALASGIERELRGRGLQLITASTDEDPERERALTEELVERRVGALVVTSTAREHPALRDELAGGLPVVLVDRPALDVEADTVVIDNRGGVRTAVSHLLARGHRRIGLVGDESRLWTFQERKEAFVATLAEAGIADPGRYVRDGAHDADRARAFVTELLSLDEPPTALVTANNKITVGALHALRDRQGSAVAERGQVALIGFDDFELADLLGVTVIGYDAAEMGRQAAALAMARAADPTRPAQLVVVPTLLVERGSGEVRPATSVPTR